VALVFSLSALCCQTVYADVVEDFQKNLTAEEKAWQAAHPEITLGFNPEIEPILIVGEDGHLTGMLVDIYDELEPLLGIKVNIEVGSWPEIIKKVRDGEIDGFLVSGEPLARSIGQLTTNHISTGKPTIFARKNAPFEINSLKDLAGKRISVLKKVYVVEQILKPYKDEIEVIEAASALEMLTLVLEGKADVAFGLHHNNFLINQHALHGIKPVFYDHEHHTRATASIRAEWPEFVSIMNKALDTVGRIRINEISQKWITSERILVLAAEDKAWLEAHKYIRLGVGFLGAPFEYLDATKNYSGVSSDYVRILNKRLHISMRPVRGLSWPEVMEKVKAGEIDVLPAVTPTAELSAFFHFTKPYIEIPLVILMRDEADIVSSIDDLQDKSIAVIKAYATEDLFNTEYPDHQPVLVNNIEEALHAVSEGRADAFVGNLVSVTYVTKKLGITNLQVVGTTPHNFALAFAVRKDWPELVTVLDRTLAAFSSLEKKDIQARWLNVRVEKQLDYSLVWKLLLGASLIFIIFAYRNRWLAREVATRVRTEMVLKVAKESAEKANRAKSIFLANMSHELRTPLNAILGFSEMLGRDPDNTPSQLEKLTIINRSGGHLLGMINDVLDLSKIEAGHIELEPEPGDLQHLLHDIGDMFRLRAETKALEFNQQLQSDLPAYLLLDVGKLRQVLINLLGNAIKFTDAGNVTLRVNAKSLSDGNWCVRFEIEDTGAGIPADKVDTIFEPFVQSGHSPARQQGTGLGLAISQKFIQLMGGEITVESTPNKGSLFHFEIPAEATDEAPTTQTEQRVVGLATNEPEWRILVVEDEADNRLLLRSLLEAVGFSVREAVNGEEAIQQFQDWQPQLIWMDMRMPVMDGYEATRHIRQLPDGKQVKILALTASAYQEQEQRILAAGCEAVLHKPYNETEIFSAMAEHLGLHYIYEEDEDLLKQLAVSKPVLEDLQGLPNEWLDEFLTTVRLGDTETMLSLTKTLPATESETKAKLEHCIREFQLQYLTGLLEEKTGTTKKV
jgi:signal transduction histidine kinase/CheY-like chemotaxis protein